MKRADLAPGRVRGTAVPVRHRRAPRPTPSPPGRGLQVAPTVPKRTDIASLLVIGASAWLAAAPARAGPSSIPAPWAVDCHAGEDGFAHNCEAVRAAGGYVLRLASADAQVFVAILHPRCETAYRNFDRTDLVGLDPAVRRALVEQAFREIEAEVRRTCPSLAPPALALDVMPDIAILSPEGES